MGDSTHWLLTPPFIFHTLYSTPLAHTILAPPQIRLDDHSHYVQGVAWDPVGHYIVSQSTDRTCKV